MAIGKQSDFTIYQEEFYGGQYEALTSLVDVFNGASAGAIQMTATDMKGDYGKESFLKEISSLVTRRDLTSVNTASDLAMTMDEYISVKVNRKIGPVAQTMNSWRKLGASPAEMSFQLGRMIGEAKAKDMIYTSIKAANAAISGQAGANVDKSGGTPTTLTHTYLVNAMALRGDKANDIVAWIGHSKSYFDLVGQTLSDKVTNVADTVIYGGGPGTLGKPFIVIDSADLIDTAGTPDDYFVLGLTAGAVRCIESEEQELVSEVVTGLEQLAVRVQGEYAFNLAVKGFKWDVANGGANPTDGNLGTSSNWDVAGTSDVKRLAGVRLQVK